METGTQLLKKISEEFAKGNTDFFATYLAEDMQWNILGSDTISGKQQVLEVMKMSQLESFPVITIKKIISEENYVVIESTGEGKTKTGKPYNQSYCEIFRFENNKLQELSTYLDTLVSKEALDS